jgi:hypothetical protein
MIITPNFKWLLGELTTIPINGGSARGNTLAALREYLN